MATVAFRGGSGDTGLRSFTDYDNNFIYDTISYPTGNLNRDGSRIVSIDSASCAFQSGATYVTVSSDGYVRVGYGTPRLTFNRNSGSGGGITDAADSTTWGGALTGSFAWSTVPSQPASISATRSGRDVLVNSGVSASNGDSAITGYKVQRRESTDGVSWGAWGSEQTLDGSRNYTYTGLNVAKYHQFRVYSVNARGNSAAASSSSVFVPASGKRRAAGVYGNMTIAKRKVAGVWQDLTIGKRKTGGSWVDLS